MYTNQNPVIFKVAFNEEVEALDFSTPVLTPDKFQATGCTVKAVSASGTGTMNWIVQVVPAEIGPFSISLPSRKPFAIVSG
jgi:hypothetical protein